MKRQQAAFGSMMGGRHCRHPRSTVGGETR